MNPLGIILPWWAKYAAIAALCASLFGYGYLRGYEHEKTAYNAFMAQVDATAKVAAANVKRVTQQQQEITANVESDWKQNAQALHDYYRTHPSVVRLCDSASSGAMSTIPKTIKGLDVNQGRDSGTGEASPPRSEGAIPEEDPPTEINLEVAGKGLLKLLNKYEWVENQAEVK